MDLSITGEEERKSISVYIPGPGHTSSTKQYNLSHYNLSTPYPPYYNTITASYSVLSQLAKNGASWAHE